MKKLLFLFLTLISMALLSACSKGVPQETYDALQQQSDTLQQQLDTLQSNYDSLTSDKEELQKNFDDLQSEYASNKEKMEPYENLEAAEIEARQIEADKIIA